MSVEAFRGRHLGEVLALLADALPADPISRTTFVRKVLLDPNFDPAGVPVAVEHGHVVGVAVAMARRFPLEDGPPDFDVGYVTLLAVAQRARGRGVGGALLQAAEDFLRERGRTACLISPYAPGYVTPGVDVSACADGLRFLETRGYAVASRPIAMECDLAASRAPDWVADRERELAASGIGFEAYVSERLPALFAFLRCHFPGDWQRFARAAADRIEQGGPAARLWLAVEGEAVVGYSHHEVERFGPIGVAPDRRGLGIGHILMYRTLAAMRLQGLHTAWFLWTDERTARRLYEGAGFRVSRRFAVLRKELGA